MNKLRCTHMSATNIHLNVCMHACRTHAQMQRVSGSQAQAEAGLQEARRTFAAQGIGVMEALPESRV